MNVKVSPGVVSSVRSLSRVFRHIEFVVPTEPSVPRGCHVRATGSERDYAPSKLHCALRTLSSRRQPHGSLSCLVRSEWCWGGPRSVNYCAPGVGSTLIPAMPARAPSIAVPIA